MFTLAFFVSLSGPFSHPIPSQEIKSSVNDVITHAAQMSSECEMLEQSFGAFGPD